MRAASKSSRTIPTSHLLLEESGEALRAEAIAFAASHPAFRGESHSPMGCFRGLVVAMVLDLVLVGIGALVWWAI
jgi:hypothetical protein